MARLRLTASKAYLGVLADGSGPATFAAGKGVQVEARVQVGVGCSFRLRGTTCALVLRTGRVYAVGWATETLLLLRGARWPPRWACEG